MGTDVIELTVYLGDHEILILIEIVDGKTVLTVFGKSLTTGIDIRCCLLEIWLGEGSHGTVEQGNICGGVVKLLLATGSTIETLGIVCALGDGILECGEGIVISLACKEQLGLLCDVSQLRVEGYSLFCLFEGLLVGPRM